jgi:hypothetical protein
MNDDGNDGMARGKLACGTGLVGNNFIFYHCCFGEGWIRFLCRCNECFVFCALLLFTFFGARGHTEVALYGVILRESTHPQSHPIELPQRSENPLLKLASSKNFLILAVIILLVLSSATAAVQIFQSLLVYKCLVSTL